MRFNYLYIFLALLVSGIGIVSCKESEEPLSYDPKWKAANEAYFLSYKDSANFVALADTLAHTNDSIYYKTLRSGSGTIPYFNDTVNVIYKGWIVKEWNTDYQTDSIFDTTTGTRFEYTGAPFAVGAGVITGWRLALQYMKVGDKWNVVIPSSMGYGASGKGTIQPYSTLNFEMQLISITRNGAIVDQISVSNGYPQ